MKFPLTAYLCGKGESVVNQCFDVFYDGKKMGDIKLCTEGLYYKIECCVTKPGMRLYLRAGEEIMDLGICIPMEYGYGFRIRKPIKSIPGKIEKFFLSDKKNELLWIEPEKPFAHLHAVSKGHLYIQNGKYYLKTEST